MTDSLCFETLFDRILMGTGEGGVDKFTCVRMTGVDGQVIALRHRVYNGLYVTDIQARMNALRIEIQSQVYEVDISCAFPIAEKTSLDPISTSKQAKFG
jgi:hypothetical protein